MSMPPRKILVSTDFSPPSLEALRYARELAAKTGAELHLLHVCTIPVHVYPGYSPVPVLNTDVEAAASKALDELAATNGALAHKMRVGIPADEILREAKEIGADLLVMATHGRSGLARVVIGSVVERVLRHSPIPVLAVPVGKNWDV